MKKIFSTLLVFLIIVLSGCTTKTELDWDQLYFFNVFGDIGVDVIIISEKDRIKNEMETTWDDLDAILTNLDDVFSINHDLNKDQVETAIQKVNRNAGIAPVVVPEEVITVIEKAIEVSEISKVNDVAQYDVTIAPLWQAWDFIKYQQTINEATVPTEEELAELIKLVDYRKIKIDKEASTVYLESKGMGLDLGSIAKGYTADVIKEYLLSKNFTRGRINVGGNIITMGESYLFGEKKDIPWKIMITTPYQTAGLGNKYFIGITDHDSVTVVTSGVYERYFTVNGKSYHHIIDPATGYPRDSDLLSLSIITQNSMTADAYSTTVFSLGLDNGMKLVEESSGMEAIAITVDKEIYVTSGLENNFVFNENVIEIGYSYKGVYRWN